MPETARLTAVVETKGAKAADRDLKKLGKTADKTEKEVVGLTKKTNKLNSTLKSTGAAIAAIDGPLGGIASRVSAVNTLISSGAAGFALLGVGITAVSFAVIKGTFALDAYAVNLKRIEANLKATGFAAGFTAEQLLDQAKTLARATLTSTEEIQKAQAALVTFKSVAGDTFTRAIELAQDMAEAGFGNLATNAIGLGRALQDPITGLTLLTRQGSLTRDQQREIADEFKRTGDIAQAQGAILAAIADQVGGAAAAVAAGTIAGAFDTLTQDTEEFTISLARLLETQGAVASFFATLSSGLKSITTGVNLDEDFNKLFLERIELSKELDDVGKGLIGSLQLEAFQELDREALRSKIATVDAQLDVIKTNLAAQNAAEQVAADKSAKIQADINASNVKLAKERNDKLQAIEDNKTAKIEAAEAKRVEAQMNRDASQLNRLIALGDSELDSINRKETQRLDLLRTIREREGEEFANFEQIKTEILKAGIADRESLEEKSQKAQNDLEDASRSAKIGSQMETLGTIVSLASTGNKKLFAIAKAAAIAQLAIDLPRSISTALASAPPPFNFALAAAVGVAHAVQAAAIFSAKPPAREQGGQFAAGQQFVMNERGQEAVIFDSPGRVLNAQQTRNLQNQRPDEQGERNLNVSFNVVAPNNTSIEEFIVNRRSLFFGMFTDFMDRRQAGLS